MSLAGDGPPTRWRYVTSVGVALLVPLVAGLPWLHARWFGRGVASFSVATADLMKDPPVTITAGSEVAIAQDLFYIAAPPTDEDAVLQTSNAKVHFVPVGMSPTPTLPLPLPPPSSIPPCCCPGKPLERCGCAASCACFICCCGVAT